MKQPPGPAFSHFCVAAPVVRLLVPEGGAVKVLRRSLAVLALAAGSAGAHAHAFLEKSDPRVGSTVATAPAELRMWFSEPLEPAFSTVQVTDTGGRHVEGARAEVDARDRALLRVPLTRLAPGTYTATWRVISVDTHASNGHFEFHVAP